MDVEDLEGFDYEDTTGKEHLTTDDVDFDTGNLIVIDVALCVAPEDSTRLKYGPGDLAFRNSVEKDWKEYKKDHPNAILDIRE